MAERLIITGCTLTKSSTKIDRNLEDTEIAKKFLTDNQGTVLGPYFLFDISPTDEINIPFITLNMLLTLCKRLYS